MSSRRKSTTPCMVLPSDVVEQEEVEERMEGIGGGEEGRKEGAKVGLTAEELGEAVMVVPTPPHTGQDLSLKSFVFVCFTDTIALRLSLFS